MSAEIESFVNTLDRYDRVDAVCEVSIQYKHIDRCYAIPKVSVSNFFKELTSSKT